MRNQQAVGEEHVIFADRPSFDSAVGMHAEANEVFVARVAEDGERLLMLESEEGQDREVEAEEETLR